MRCANPTDWLPCPELHYVVGTEEGARAVAERGGDPSCCKGVSAVTVGFPEGENGFGSVLVVIDRGIRERGGDQLHALLAHESVHVAQRWLEAIGEGRPGEEELAYMAQASMLCLLEADREAK